MQQPVLFNFNDNINEQNISSPKTYKGITGFHKYWGKKPTESLNYFIQKCTQENEIVLDPFLGSGLVSLEANSLERRFLGIDLNPFSIEHTEFLLSLPSAKDYMTAVKNIKSNVLAKINGSYLMQSEKIATHYLWKNEELIQVWSKNEKSKKVENLPTDFDLQKISEFKNYEIRNVSNGIFFENPRINSFSGMTVYDLFTKRALRNIDLLLDEINKYSGDLQRALLLTLTSSSGQMSSMVFAITSRGKTKNASTKKIEVGSWVIGLWRPELHFEINVWNCFENRAKKLYKALQECSNDSIPYENNVKSFFQNNAKNGIILGDSKSIMKEIPDKTIKLIITDPPHSDRIPYLELSEMWNCILNKKSDFENEIVVSNAKERNKSKTLYTESMSEILVQSNRILKDDGYLLLYFNARDNQSWDFFKSIESNTSLVFLGAFPMEYSANSVVQDNRKGSMKSDYVLVFNHTKNNEILSIFKGIKGWTEKVPTEKMYA